MTMRSFIPTREELAIAGAAKKYRDRTLLSPLPKRLRGEIMECVKRFLRIPVLEEELLNCRWTQRGHCLRRRLLRAPVKPFDTAEGHRTVRLADCTGAGPQIVAKARKGLEASAGYSDYMRLTGIVINDVSINLPGKNISVSATYHGRS